jgi:putative chitinase
MVPSLEHLIASGAGESIAQKWIASVQQACTRFDIQSPERIAAFLAQVSHESAAFTTTIENLNYSAALLKKVFRRYFPDDATASSFAHQPEKIANRVYANRLGNGPEASGDGWKYRGRGLIQLTGRDNVTAYSTGVYGDNRLVDDPSPLSAVNDASLSAGWFWDAHQLNQLADQGQFELITKRINGGLNGLEDRVAKWNAVRRVLGLAPG